jgi:hypothetical protein|tara:strand:- start:559 stop:813 length:255 start_codon:yes stop_codon:yes gene_type:complete
MKVGDYVAKVQNKWQEHNSWMEFPNDPPIPLGVIVSKGVLTVPVSPPISRYEGSSVMYWCEVLESCGKIGTYNETKLKVVSGYR